MKDSVLLIDPPTFPKGTISLSLFVLAGFLKDKYLVDYLDLNFRKDNLKLNNLDNKKFQFIGLKVSSQNIEISKSLTKKLKIQFPLTPIVWGGEFVTLQPEFCHKYADTIITGMFESVSKKFIDDLEKGNLLRQYNGKNDASFGIGSPYFEILPSFKRYNQFMGLPLETSRGCTEHCSFCMVHSTQSRNYFTKPLNQIEEELKYYSDKFINVIDYNFGISEDHVLGVCDLITRSRAIGWMAEMNIELLDNKNVLSALKKSRCRIIYCGLESIHETSLKELNKQKTNNPLHYERIVRKAQSYGIHIVAGIILGLGNSEKKTYLDTINAFNKWGLGYIKLTFLTYNPGSRIFNYHSKNNRIISNQFSDFDGQRITFVSEKSYDELKTIAETVLEKISSNFQQFLRIKESKANYISKIEMFLFALLYSRIYRQWKSYKILNKPENLNLLLTMHYKKSVLMKICEKILYVYRKTRTI